MGKKISIWLDNLRHFFEPFWINLFASFLCQGGWSFLIWAWTLQLDRGNAATNWDYLRMEPQWIAGTVFCLATWLFLLSWHTLVFVYRNHCRRKRAFWVLYGMGMTLLTGCIALHFTGGVAVGVIMPTRFFLDWLRGSSSDDQIIEGTEIVPGSQAGRPYRRKRGASVGFGAYNLPISELVYGMIIVGAIGSGKSTYLEGQVLRHIVPLIKRNSGKRMVILDAQQTYISKLYGILGDQTDTTLWIMNVFDTRTVAWNLAKDITEFAHSETAAKILIPEPTGQGDNSFFYQAAQKLLQGLMEYYMIHCPERWTLKDLIWSTKDRKTLEGILASDPYTAQYLDVMARESERTVASVIATLKNCMLSYRIIAAMWDRAPTKISLKDDFLPGGVIMVLGQDRRAEASLSAVNRLIMYFLSQMLLAEESCLEPRTFIVLDEFPSIKIDNFQPLVVQGRGKGNAVIVAFQSIENVKQVYGADIAETITGQLRNKVFCRLDDTKTTAWASDTIGQQTIRVHTTSWTWHSLLLGLLGYGEKVNEGEQVITKAAVLPSAFRKINPIAASTKSGLEAYFISRTNHFHRYSWLETQGMFLPKSEIHLDFIPAPAEWQKLRGWDESDWTRLGISEIMRKLEQEESTEATQHQKNGHVPQTTTHSVKNVLEDLNSFITSHRPSDEDDDLLELGNPKTEEEEEENTTSSNGNHPTQNQNSTTYSFNKQTLTEMLAKTKSKKNNQTPKRNLNNNRDFTL